MQLEKMILNGLTSRLQRAFRFQDPPTFISSSDRWHLADRLKGQQQGNAANQNTLTLPHAFLRLVTLSVNNESYSPGALALTGKYGAKKEGSEVVTRYELLPVTYAFEFIHLSQDFMDMFRFARDYVLHSYRRRDLNFTLNYDGLAIDIRVMMDDNVSPPEKDASVDAVNTYELTSNVRVNGWVTDDLENAVQVPVVQRVHHDLVPTLTPPPAN